MRYLRLSVAALVLFATGFLVSNRLWPAASADDPLNTTSLALDTDVFDTELPAIQAVTADFTTTDDLATRAQIDLYFRPAGTFVETYTGSMWTNRQSPGLLGVKYQLPQAEFQPGMTVRAQFTAFNQGQTIFTLSRVVQIP